MVLAILDTDTLSEAFKQKDPRVLALALQYLSVHGQFSFSEMSYYEMIRGLLSRRSEKVRTAFLDVVSDSEVIPITQPILLVAAQLWVAALAGGHPKQDADLIIAATALTMDRVLVTGNTRHFNWIPGLSIVNWRDT